MSELVDTVEKIKELTHKIEILDKQSVLNKENAFINGDWSVSVLHNKHNRFLTILSDCNVWTDNNQYMSHIPIKFKKVDGRFQISEFIETLENCAEEVESFAIDMHSKLKSLKGMPEIIHEEAIINNKSFFENECAEENFKIMSNVKLDRGYFLLWNKLAHKHGRYKIENNELVYLGPDE